MITLLAPSASAEQVDRAHDRVTDRGAVLRRQLDDADLVEQPEQRLVIEGRWADVVGVAGKGDHADGIAATAVEACHRRPVTKSRQSVALTTSRRLLGRPSRPQIDRAHAAGGVDHHRDRDAFALDPWSPRRPIAGRQARAPPGSGSSPRSQGRAAWRRAAADGRSRASSVLTGKPIARRTARRRTRGQQHGHQQQKEQRLRMVKSHRSGALAPERHPVAARATVGRLRPMAASRIRSPPARRSTVNRSTTGSLTRLSVRRAHAIRAAAWT